MSILKTTTLITLLIIGSLLFLNGLVHSFLYFFDEYALFQGLRYINWLTLVIGAGMSIFCFNQLNKPKQTTTQL